MRIILFILIISFVMPVYGQRRKKGDDEVAPTYIEGVVYSLPRTGVRIHVKAVEERFQPGPFAAYAEQLLGISNAKTRASVNWNISGVKLETFSEPDPSQVHKAMGDASFLVSLTPEGCLAGINTRVDAGAVNTAETNSFIFPPEKEDDFRFSGINDAPLYVSGDSTNNYRPVRLGAEQRAAEAAGKILESRKTQYDIPAGMMDEFHPDGTAYEVSLRELKQIEDEYMSLFVGRTTRKSREFSFNFVPTSENEKGEVVFRFSEENGVVPASDLSGKPVMMKITPNKELAGKYAGLTASENPTAGESGIYYRMPGMAEVELIFELKTIANMHAPLAQFGAVAPLPEELLFGDYAIEIHPHTGAIKSITKK